MRPALSFKTNTKPFSQQTAIAQESGPGASMLRGTGEAARLQGLPRAAATGAAKGGPPLKYSRGHPKPWGSTGSQYRGQRLAGAP